MKKYQWAVDLHFNGEFFERINCKSFADALACAVNEISAAKNLHETVKAQVFIECVDGCQVSRSYFDGESFRLGFVLCDDTGLGVERLPERYTAEVIEVRGMLSK